MKVKENMNKLKEKGKEFYEKNKFFLGYCVGVGAYVTVHHIYRKINGKTKVTTGIMMAKSEDYPNSIIVQMELINKKKKPLYQMRGMFDKTDFIKQVNELVDDNTACVDTNQES